MKKYEKYRQMCIRCQKFNYSLKPEETDENLVKCQKCISPKPDQIVFVEKTNECS
jgi:hypothetical protein